MIMMMMMMMRRSRRRRNKLSVCMEEVEERLHEDADANADAAARCMHNKIAAAETRQWGSCLSCGMQHAKRLAALPQPAPFPSLSANISLSMLKNDVNKFQRKQFG